MKIVKKFLPAVILSFSFFFGCNTPKHNPADVMKSINENNTLFAKSFNDGDITALMTFYKSGSEVMPPNFSAVKGKSEIKQFWQKGMKIYSNLDLKADTVDIESNTAIETGSYSIIVQMPGQPAITDMGKYLVVWKYMTNDTWKIDKDIYNSNLPISHFMPADGGPKKK